MSNPRDPRGGPRGPREPRELRDDQGELLKDTVVSINRVTKVVKGGKNLSFSALVIVGDEKGRVGYGSGKAKEVPSAIRKAIETAKKSMIRVPIINNTTPHQVLGVFGAGRVLLKPAAEGTGVIAGGAIRAILEVAGFKDVLTKCLGSRNPHNVCHATVDALQSLMSPEATALRRGLSIEEMMG